VLDDDARVVRDIAFAIDDGSRFDDLRDLLAAETAVEGLRVRAGGFGLVRRSAVFLSRGDRRRQRHGAGNQSDA
jgi:hypothetical protein